MLRRHQTTVGGGRRRFSNAIGPDIIGTFMKSPQLSYKLTTAIFSIDSTLAYMWCSGCTAYADNCGDSLDKHVRQQLWVRSHVFIVKVDLLKIPNATYKNPKLNIRILMTKRIMHVAGALLSKR